MATKVAVRYVSRRFSSGGKILSEEEKAAKNICIKKMEQERLEKLPCKGQKAEDTSASFWGYAVVAGVATGLGALGWHLKSKNRFRQETLDLLKVIEFNNERSGMFCSYVHVGHGGTTLKWERRG